MYKVSLGGVEIRRVFAPKKAIRGALIALDAKIFDFEERLNDTSYAKSTRALMDLSEIVGEIKFMYLSSIINAREYRTLYAHITGQECNDDY